MVSGRSSSTALPSSHSIVAPARCGRRAAYRQHGWIDVDRHDPTPRSDHRRHVPRDASRAGGHIENSLTLLRDGMFEEHARKGIGNGPAEIPLIDFRRVRAFELIHRAILRPSFISRPHGLAKPAGLTVSWARGSQSRS